MRSFIHIVFAACLALTSTVVVAGDVQKGWKAYNSTDYATAKAEWQEAADAGDADAAYGMGLLYGNGFGVDMNDELALKYYGIAADQGHGDAAFNLAVMHQNGWGVPQDESVANEWYLLAAEKGNTEAQMALGRFFAMDFQASFDPLEAYKWFSIAAGLGEYGANEKREFIASRMTPEQIAEADALVDAWATSHKALYDAAALDGY